MALRFKKWANLEAREIIKDKGMRSKFITHAGIIRGLLWTETRIASWGWRKRSWGKGKKVILGNLGLTSSLKYHLPTEEYGMQRWWEIVVLWFFSWVSLAVWTWTCYLWTWYLNLNFLTYSRRIRLRMELEMKDNMIILTIATIYWVCTMYNYCALHGVSFNYQIEMLYLRYYYSFLSLRKLRWNNFLVSSMLVWGI